MNEKKTMLMTNGSIWKNIIIFSIPIFIGQLFQQMYNIIDSIIVGNFVSDKALAAVTSTGALTFLFIGLVSGIFMGAGVLISRYFGANDVEGVSKSIHTSVAFSIVCGILLTVVGVLFTPYILRIMDTPSDVIKDSTVYLQIIFAGSIFTVLYNCFNGIYQAVGDTKSPLYFLVSACIVNIVLDLVFILVFNMGVMGAALATVIGQMVSALLALIFLCRTNDIYRINFKHIAFHRGFVYNIMLYGLPAGIQNSVISLANVVVQSNINAFGSDAMAGSGAYTRIEGIAFIPVTSFTFALTTFVSQNLGAKEPARAKKGAAFGMISCILIAQAFGLLLFFFADFFIALFNDDLNVIKHGVSRAKIISLFYFLMAFTHGASAVLRGAGKSVIPMLTTLICWCILRVLYIEVTLIHINAIEVIFWAYPITWSLSSIVLGFMLYNSKWTNIELI